MTIRVPLNDPTRQLDRLSHSLHETVARVIDSGRWLMGLETNAFEQEFAAYCGTEHTVAVANGTDGLEIALRAVGAAGAEVVNVANAGGYTTTACRIVGSVPVFVDVDPETLVMDVGAALAAVGPNTRAIVVTHLYGNLADVLALKSGLDELGRDDVKVIEDCSQAHGARIGGRHVGSFGDLAVFSFYPTKNLGALGDAGAVITSDDQLHRRIRLIHQYGWSDRYVASATSGRNSRIDEIQAAVLRLKLPYLDDWNSERREIVRAYAKAAEGTPVRIATRAGDADAAHLAIARVPDREAFARHLESSGIAWSVHFPVLDPDQTAEAGLPARTGSLDFSREAVREIVTLPCFPGMREDEVDAVSETIASFE